MRLPISINSDEEYAIAAERIHELEFEPGQEADDDELVALTEAMLKWEMRKNIRADDE